MTDLIPWRPAASRAVALLREASSAPQATNLGAGLAIFARDAPPDTCLLGRALRDQAIWGGRLAEVGLMQQGYQPMAVCIQSLAELAEKRARDEGARAVGERHVAAELVVAGADHFGVNATDLLAAVTAAELGPELPSAEIQGRHHVLVDTSILIQFHDLEHIDWIRELGEPAVVVWVPGTVLNELDLLQGTSPARRVRDRAKHFAKWIEPRMAQALEASGEPIRDGVRLRVWAPASPGGLRDTDHLEAVLELRERGVPVVLVTDDLGMRARAMTQRIPVAALSPEHALEEEKTAAERESTARLAAEGILAPPGMRLTLDSRGPEGDRLRWILTIHCRPDGGQARSTVIRWRTHGGEMVVLVDRLTERTTAPRGDGFVHQRLDFLLSPGSAEILGEILSAQPVGALEYVIRADGAQERRGELVWTGQTYEERELHEDGLLGPGSAPR